MPVCLQRSQKAWLRSSARRARSAAAEASAAARDLDDVRRQAAAAAEDGRARIKDAQDKAESLMVDLKRRDEELRETKTMLARAREAAGAA